MEDLNNAQTSEPVSTPEPVDFRSSLPEDLREEASLADIKDVGSLAKSYVNAQRMLGSSIRIPGQDAGEEQMKVGN